MNGDCIHILLVEDNPGDIRLTELAFKRGRIANKLFIARDGAEALDFLYRRDQYENALRPHLILLDLNLPKKNGREVLNEIKNDPNLKDIPVCILTGSKAEEDVVKSYKLHANCYIVKPVDFDQFIEVVKSIEHFWFKIVVVPHAPAQV
jgi:two-component system, chemotaxis family, response regulator Rcp1